MTFTSAFHSSREAIAELGIDTFDRNPETFSSITRHRVSRSVWFAVDDHAKHYRDCWPFHVRRNSVSAARMHEIHRENSLARISRSGRCEAGVKPSNIAYPGARRGKPRPRTANNKLEGDQHRVSAYGIHNARQRRAILMARPSSRYRALYSPSCRWLLRKVYIIIRYIWTFIGLTIRQLSSQAAVHGLVSNSSNESFVLFHHIPFLKINCKMWEFKS